MTPFHPEVLPQQQAAVLPSLARAAVGEGFYLAGGTAVAIRLGHRRSVDFDWFRASDILDPLSFAAELRKQGLSVDVLETRRSTLHAVVGGVRTSFLSYSYPLLRRPETWSATGCSVASLDDLACMKLAAIGQQGARRDFVDLHFILRDGVRLGDLLALYRKKFSVADVAHILVALTYFEDARREPMPTMLVPMNWETLEEKLRRAVKDVIDLGTA